MMKTNLLHQGPFTLRNVLAERIDGVSIDSRNIPEGYLFCALKGEHADGHSYVSSAIRNGAVAALVSRGYAETAPADEPLIIVEDTYAGLRDMAALYAKTLPMPVFAITGSAGKTSTRRLLAHVLRSRMTVAETAKNYNNHIGVPMTVLQIRGDEDIALIEMGTSGPGEIRDLCSVIPPHYGMITAIAHAHIGGFGSIENVQKAKYELFDALAPDGTLFINADDPRVSAYPQDGRKRISYGLENPADFAFIVAGIDAQGRYKLSYKGDTLQLRSMGKGAALNAVAAYAAARTLGLGQEEIFERIASFMPQAGRGKLEHWGDITLIDDTYNANPLSVKNAIDALVDMDTPGKKIMVFGDMLEMGPEARSSHEMIGEAIADSDISYLFCYGKDSVHTANKAREEGILTVRHFHSKRDLAGVLMTVIRAEDIILFKGSRGMAMEEIISLIKDM